MRPLQSALRVAAVLGPIILVILVGGCRSTVPVPMGDPVESAPSDEIRQRLVVVVHGDASYLYHDAEGDPHQADAETLREVFAAAQDMPRSEVFIFHQRPESSVFGLFARDDGTFYHFRRGRLHTESTYDQDRTEPLKAEAALLRSHRASAGDSSLFTAAMYYGHAVPERSRPGYHRSRSDVPFGIEDLAHGLDRMIGPSSSSFDAVVLSTCNGGTPHTLTALEGRAEVVLASPGELHLSFVDADLLPSVSSTRDAGTWTRHLAEQAFIRLSDRTTTAVTLSTYHLRRIDSTARRMARETMPDTSTAPTGSRHVDCRAVLDVPVDTAGVRTWFRPAQFGPRADQESHSGWGCPQPADGALHVDEN